MNAPLAEMFRYNRWANLRLIEACRALDDTLLDTRVSATSGTVRELLLHIVGGQQTFVLRTKGRQHEGELDRGSGWPGFAELARLATVTSDELIQLAASLETDASVELPWLGKRFRYPTSFFLVHALEHGVEHRTEIKLALAQLGVATPDLDAWDYATAAGYGKEV